MTLVLPLDTRIITESNILHPFIILVITIINTCISPMFSSVYVVIYVYYERGYEVKRHVRCTLVYKVGAEDTQNDLLVNLQVDQSALQLSVSVRNEKIIKSQADLIFGGHSPGKYNKNQNSKTILYVTVQLTLVIQSWGLADYPMMILGSFPYFSL